MERKLKRVDNLCWWKKGLFYFFGVFCLLVIPSITAFTVFESFIHLYELNNCRWGIGLFLCFLAGALAGWLPTILCWIFYADEHEVSQDTRLGFFLGSVSAWLAGGVAAPLFYLYGNSSDGGMVYGFVFSTAHILTVSSLTDIIRGKDRELNELREKSGF